MMYRSDMAITVLNPAVNIKIIFLCIELEKRGPEKLLQFYLGLGLMSQI